MNRTKNFSLTFAYRAANTQTPHYHSDFTSYVISLALDRLAFSLFLKYVNLILFL